MNMRTLTPQQLRKAADLKERIDGLAEQLKAIVGGGETAVRVAPEEAERLTNGRRKRRGRLSAEGRAAISAAAKARWAAMKARWAKAKRAGRSRL
jgi:hypothetical protein